MKEDLMEVIYLIEELKKSNINVFNKLLNFLEINNKLKKTD